LGTATVFDKEFVVGVNKAELVKELQRLGWCHLVQMERPCTLGESTAVDAKIVIVAFAAQQDCVGQDLCSSR
jgi:hypothetical protein